jgi:hypothetical protein
MNTGLSSTTCETTPEMSKDHTPSKEEENSFAITPCLVNKSAASNLSRGFKRLPVE